MAAVAHEQGRFVDVDPRPGTGRRGGREVDEHRRAVPVDDDVVGAQTPVDQTGVVQAGHVAPHVVEDAVGDLDDVELVERGPGWGDGDLYGVVVGSRRPHRDEARHGDIGPLRQQQQQGAVLHLSEPRGGEPGSALLVPDPADELTRGSVQRGVAADHDDGDGLVRRRHSAEEALRRLVVERPLEVTDWDPDLGEGDGDVTRSGASFGGTRARGGPGRPPPTRAARWRPPRWAATRRRLPRREPRPGARRGR